MPPTTPALPDEILELIFLRLPPDEPGRLVRASLTCKLWLSLLSGPSFQGRYREFHGAPPMLGFVYSLSGYPGSGPLFVSTKKLGAHVPNDKKFDVYDCRHGLVLLGDKGVAPKMLLVCDPMTGYWRELHMPKHRYYYSHVAAVLCAVTGCDHRVCHTGPFQVVFVSLDNSDHGSIAHVRVSSLLRMDERSEPYSRLDEWSEPCSHLHLGERAFIDLMPPVLIVDALYFMLTYGDDGHVGILKYELGSECLSLIDAPLGETDIVCDVILISMEDASLGFAHVNGLTLTIWSRHEGSEGVATWTQPIVINLKNLFPIHYLKERLRLIESVEGRDIIFVTTSIGTYQINLKSLWWQKIWKRENCRAFFPYMRFYSWSGRKHVKRNNLEMAKCAVGRSNCVRRAKRVPNRRRSYYGASKYSWHKPRSLKKSQGRATQ